MTQNPRKPVRPHYFPEPDAAERAAWFAATDAERAIWFTRDGYAGRRWGIFK